MARSSAEISQAIRAKLAILDPDISADPLTPERKIIDTVADVLAETEASTYVSTYQYDIDTKVGADLDKFVALFGFARQQGRRATGTVTFSRSTAATTDILIPAGTQVTKPATSVTAAVVFQTSASSVLYRGTTSVDAPVECTVTGPIGNVSQSTITGFTQFGDISSVTNSVATTGGTAIETDAQLRVRFKNTIFRNIVGTSDQYLALAIASRFANKANVVGPISRFIEYVQIASNTPSAGQNGAVSQIPYSKYTYSFDYYLTDGQSANETFYAPSGVDFTFNTTVAPSIQSNNATNLPVGKVVLLEHSYCSKNSRNDPANNIMNYVDVFVSGQDAASATESCQYPASSTAFNNTSSSPYYASNYKRDATGVTPTIGNLFQELLWQPVTILPSTITIGGNTYTLNTHYWLVVDTTTYKGSRRGRCGIEWASTVAQAAGDTFSLTYTFDKLPLTLNELMDDHKQITTDVLVHAATRRYFVVNLVVMYTPGYSKSAVDTALTTALTDFLEKQQFGAVIQVSDILETAHEVPGVDNVRLTTSTDSATYGIQEVASNGTTTIGSPYTNDFALQDSDLPILSSINTIQRSQNTWSS